MLADCDAGNVVTAAQAGALEDRRDRAPGFYGA